MSIERLCPSNCERCKENVSSILQVAAEANNIRALVIWKCKQLVSIAKEARSANKLPSQNADPYKPGVNPFAEFLESL